MCNSMLIQPIINQKTIFIVGQGLHLVYGEKQFYNYLIRIFNNLKDLENTEIKLKHHPRDKKTYIWENALKHHKIKYEIVKTVNANKNEEYLYKALADADLVLSFGSNVCIDALVFGTPVILIEIDVEKNYLTDCESIIRVDYKDDFKPIIKKWLRFKDL